MLSSGLKVKKQICRYSSAQSGELLDIRHLSISCFSLHCLEVEDDFSLVGQVVVFVGDLVRDHSALELGILVFDQVESNGHQRVDVSGLKKRRKGALQITGYCCISCISYFPCSRLENQFLIYTVLF